MAHCGEKPGGLQGEKQLVSGGTKQDYNAVCLMSWHVETTRTAIMIEVEVDDDFGNLERVMHIERSDRCMDVEMKRHPGERRDPDSGGRLDSRVRGNDHYSYERCLLTLQST